MSYDALLTQTATVEREAITYGNTGSPVRAWTEIATGVSCVIQQGGKDYVSGMRGEEDVAKYVGFFQYGASLKAGDRLTVSDKNGTEIGKFMILHVPVDVSGRMHHIEADVEFLDEEVYPGS